MSVDLLRVEPNQRVDYNDFSYMIDESMTAIMRDIADNFLLDPDGALADRMRILDGFEMTNPVGKQLTVTLGRALLAERIEGVVRYGALVSSGAASQIIDLAPLASATYGVYIRFEYVDEDSASRVFWNPAGTGTEFVQNVPTRRAASWSLRAELVSPGPEWLLIGTANNAGAGLVLVDQRVLYFEGPVAGGAYTSGWSTEGGGAATDRDPDRLTYGVKDLHTFTAAMKQCVEDIKGRGLRRWWDKGIGGINVGFDDDPFEDTMAVGDDEAYLWNGGTHLQPTLGFDTDDWFWYDRPTNTFHWGIATIDEAILNTAGLSLAKGLYVGSTAGVPTADDVTVDGDFLAPTGGVNAGGSAVTAAGDGIFTRGLVVGFDQQPTPDQVQVGDQYFRMQWDGTDPIISFDNDDYLIYDRSANMLLGRYLSANTFAWRFLSGDISCTGGIRAGSISAGYDNDFLASSGGISCGTTRDPNSGEGIFVGGVSAGWDGNPGAGFVYLNSASFLLGPVGGAPTLQFATNNWMRYNSGPDQLTYVVGNSEQMRMRFEGVSIAKGLYVGNTSFFAEDDSVKAPYFISGNSQYNFGNLLSANDYIKFNSTGDIFEFYRSNLLEYSFAPSAANFYGATLDCGAITTTSLDAGSGAITTTGAVSGGTLAATAGNIDVNGFNIVDCNVITADLFRLELGGYDWDLSGTDMIWHIASAEKMRLDANGMWLRSGGLYVGGVVIPTPVDGVIEATVRVEAPTVEGTTVSATTSMTSPFFDASSYIEAPTMRFDANNRIAWVANQASWYLNNANVSQWRNDGLGDLGLIIQGGIHVGPATRTPFGDSAVEGRISIGEPSFYLEYGTNPTIAFSSGDYFQYDWSNNRLHFYIGSSEKGVFTSNHFAAPKLRAVSTDAAPDSTSDVYSRTVWNSVVCAGYINTDGSGNITGYDGWNVSSVGKTVTGLYVVTCDHPLHTTTCAAFAQMDSNGTMSTPVGTPTATTELINGNIYINTRDGGNNVTKNYLSGKIYFCAIGRGNNTTPSSVA